MKFLFFPQNETHLENMLPVAKIIEKDGENNASFLDAGGIYHQEIFSGREIGFEKIRVDFACEKPFYFESPIKKIAAVNKFIKYAKNRFYDYDAFIFCNDGAFQRVLVNNFKDARSFLILDGIISDYTFPISDVLKFSDNKLSDLKDHLRRKIKFFITGFFKTLPYNYYLPSEVGSANLTGIFVQSDYVKSVLASQKISKEKIEVTGLPRFEFLDNIKKSAKKTSEPPLKFTLITQGYSWHNEFANDSNQHKEIKKIIPFVEKINNSGRIRIDLKIRLHPRDIKKNYDYVNPSYLEAPNTPIYESLKNSDVILGFNSTVLVEALHIGKPVLVLATHGQFWRFKRSFVNNRCFIKIFNIEDFENFIDNFIKTGELPQPKNLGLDYLFNPESAKSAFKIADIINENLKEVKK